MNWNIEEIAASVRDLKVEERLGDAISVPLFDRDSCIGIGIDGSGDVALVLPGQESESAFETVALKFDPWCDATLIEDGQTLRKCSVLRCRVDRTDEQILRLVIGLLSSLIEMQTLFGNAGNAIWALKELFGDGFNARPNQNNLRGLIGELLVINAAEDIPSAVKAWHVDTDDRYDFSIHDRRVEVKTTTSTVREHRFNSRQLPPQANVEVWVASVKLAEVAVGDDISSLFSSISQYVSIDEARKIAEIIIETVGLPPMALTQPSFDLSSSLQSIRLYRSELVPTPLHTPGTSDIRWAAFLKDDEGLSFESYAKILSSDENA